MPQPPEAGPARGDQVNLTDPDSRIMQTSCAGFEQFYNAQAVVEAGSLLVVAADVVKAPPVRVRARGVIEFPSCVRFDRVANPCTTAIRHGAI